MGTFEFEKVDSFRYVGTVATGGMRGAKKLISKYKMDTDVHIFTIFIYRTLYRKIRLATELKIWKGLKKQEEFIVQEMYEKYI